MSNGEKTYNLENRTLQFSKDLVVFCNKIKKDNISISLVSQLVRAGTSVGANYMEANGASSRKDFKNKIHICKKEAQETKYWLNILSEIFPESKPIIRNLWIEAHEFSKIFGKIVSTMSNKSI